MIVYNVTIKVDLSIHDEWVQWMKLVHIPEVLETGYFNDHRMMRILDQDETDGVTYAIQYFARDMQAYFDYKANDAERLQKDVELLYKDKYVAFRTLMRVV